MYLVLDQNATELFGSFSQQAEQIHAWLTGYDQHTGLAYLNSELILDTTSNRLDGMIHNEIFAGTRSSGSLTLTPAAIPDPTITITELSGSWASDRHAILGDVSLNISSELILTGHSTTGCLLNGRPEKPIGIVLLHRLNLELSSCDSQDGVHEGWLHFYRNENLQPIMEMFWDSGDNRPVYLHYQPG
jgi:hypothetical protein